MRWIRDFRWWRLKRKIDKVTGGEPGCNVIPPESGSTLLRYDGRGSPDA